MTPSPGPSLPATSIFSAGLAVNALRVAPAAILLLLGTAMAVTTAIAVFWAYSPIPFGDQWNAVLPSEYWAQLFDQHNEHRILFPRLFFLVDLLVFNGTNVFNLSAIFAIQLVHTALLAWVARRGGLADGALFWCSTAIVFGLMFWAYQIENFSWGFQVQFVGVFAAATAAFARLALGRHGWTGVMTAILFGAVAAYSMANGFLAPFLLAVLGWWLRLPWRQIAVLAIAAIVLLALYLRGYHSPVGHSDPLIAIRNFHIVIEYALCYLGGPFSQLILSSARQPGTIIVEPNVALAMAIGAAGVAAFLALLAAELRLRRPAQGVFLAIMAMGIATALITGMGRISFSLEQAFAQRYGTPAMVFWCATLLSWLSRHGAPVHRRAWAVLLLGAVTLVGAAVNQRAFLQYARDVGVFRRQGATAILADSHDRSDLEMLYPSAPMLLTQTEKLRKARLSVFSEDWAGWRGTSLASHVRLEPGQNCTGSIDQIAMVSSDGPPAWRISGWGVHLPQQRPSRRLLLTDGAGTVTGYAYAGLPRADVRQALPDLYSDRVGWRGHAQLAGDGVVTAWLLADDGSSACPLPASQLAGRIGIAGLLTTPPRGGEVEMQPAEVTGQWSEPGTPPETKPLPGGGRQYGSWAGSGQATGTLHWRSAALPGGAVLAIPVTAGPSASGLSVRVLVADSGAILVDVGTVILPDWQTLKIKLPQGVTAIDIELIDNGGDSWLAVGQPRLW